MRTKVMLIFLIIISMVVMSACSSNNNNTNSNSAANDNLSTNKSGDTNSNSEDPANSDKSEDGMNEKYTITGLTSFNQDPPADDGGGLQALNERFNIDLQMAHVLSSNYIERLSAVFASGEIPDVTRFPAGEVKGLYNQFSHEGAFLPLDEYIDQYPTLKMVPEYIWDALRVDGKVYGIPIWAPKIVFNTMVRKDWLDNLGLEVPTNYEELKEVALAFTTDDPDQNNKDDTYGISMSQNINPPYTMGAYWSEEAWYHKNDKGQFIPGMIGPGRKEVIQFHADLYAGGALTQDFAVMNWAEANNEFYSGTAGIFISVPNGMVQKYMESLFEIDPEAEVIHLPPFEAPDGSVGHSVKSGYRGVSVLSAEMADNPGKIKRILDIFESTRTFVPNDERGPDNELFDFWEGGAGNGYDMVNGVPIVRPDSGGPGIRPRIIWMHGEWPQNDGDKDFVNTYSFEPLRELTQRQLDMLKTMKYYANPALSIVSPTDAEIGAELNQYLMDEQTKMIVGARPISEWDQMVDDYLAKGGAKIIDEVNAEIEIDDPLDSFFNATQ